jgi:hypothetical protein
MSDRGTPDWNLELLLVQVVGSIPGILAGLLVWSLTRILRGPSEDDG